MGENPPKKVKMDNDLNQKSIHNELKSLVDFKVDKIISENSQRKTITLQGTFEGHDGVGIVLLEKKPFAPEKISDFFCEEATVEKQFSNDVYGNYEAVAPKNFMEVKTTVIHPADEKQLQKYQVQKIYLVNETPDLYKSVCLPLLDKEKLHLQWVYNILEHKAESDRIVYEDTDPETGFILLPDLKWDGKSKESLYLLAIVRKIDIRSLRDLTAEHLPLLKNVLQKGTEAITQKYGVAESELRVYMHYRPTFYHLHVHFVALQYDAPGTHVERAHMLTTVISNLEIASDYYSKANLPVTIKETEQLFEEMEKHEIVKRIIPTKLEKDVQEIITRLSSILIEFRPRLQASQFHFTFANITDEALDALQISIPSLNTVQIVVPDCILNFELKSTQLVPDKISSLVKNKNYVSFRVQTNPVAITGSLTRELLLSSHKYIPKVALPRIETIYKIFCRNCWTPCIKSLTLKRVLPLPSTSWQEVDWYCHKHDGEETASSKLAPKEGDCFYATGIWLLHAPTSITSTTTCVQGSIFCCSCKLELGEIKEDIATLWNFAVVWLGHEIDDTIGLPDLALDVAKERDFTELIKEAALDTVGTKLLLTSKCTHRTIPPLLIWALNSPLKVIQWRPVCFPMLEVSLPEPKSALPLLYKTNVDQAPEDAQVLSIPRPIFEQGLQLLESTTEMLPIQYRSSDGYEIGFICV